MSDGGKIFVIVILVVAGTTGCDGAGPTASRPNESVAKPAPKTAVVLPPKAGTAPVSSVAYRFAEVAQARGVDFSYHNGAQGKMHLWETMGGGVAVLDLDGDGWMDLYFTNGCDDPFNPQTGSNRGRLFRNSSDATFTDVTDESISHDSGYGQGCAVGDCDNDGFDDLFVTRYGSASLYRNNGDGTFRDLTPESGVDCPLWNTACAFADLSGHGALDLFVTGYLEIDLAAEPACRDRRGTLAYCGPDHFDGQPFQLFRNMGDGEFSDVSDEAGVVVPKSKGLAAAVIDLDDDGRLDIFVVNDAEPARLFCNRGDGRFEDHGVTAALAYTGDGHVFNGMGIALSDYNGDGHIDLAVSNFYEKGVVLFQNRGGGSFRDKSVQTRLGPATRPRTSFGLAFLDVENDGWPDLFVANGHLSDLSADGIPYAMKAQLFQNRAGAEFRDASEQIGEYFATERLGRGVAVADWDNDGGTDVVVSHNTGPIAVLRNETQQRGHFLSVQLVGTHSSRTPVGARLTATLDGRTLVHCLAGGGSYLSASDQRILIGLGTATAVQDLEVLWPSGRREHWTDLPANQSVRLMEGRSPLFHIRGNPSGR